jgi:DNA-binding MarR family transcriptional regulator
MSLSPIHNLAWRKFLVAHALVLERIQRDLADAELPPLEWYDVLYALAEAPDRRLRLHELAQAVLLSRSNVTRLVDRLEKAELLYRVPCLSDRRGAFAVINDAGLAMQERMWVIYSQGIAQYFACHFDGDEAKLLAKLLKRMSDPKVEAMGGESSDELTTE